MKTFVILEKSIVKFIVVKFFISLATGISFSIACLGLMYLSNILELWHFIKFYTNG